MAFSSKQDKEKPLTTYGTQFRIVDWKIDVDVKKERKRQKIFLFLMAKTSLEHYRKMVDRNPNWNCSSHTVER